MLRLWCLLRAALALAGCAGPTYTIEGATMATANGRAERYCAEREAKARLEGFEQDGSARVEIYRCVPPRVLESEE